MMMYAAPRGYNAPAYGGWQAPNQPQSYASTSKNPYAQLYAKKRPVVVQQQQVIAQPSPSPEPVAVTQTTYQTYTPPDPYTGTRVNIRDTPEAIYVTPDDNEYNYEYEENVQETYQPAPPPPDHRASHVTPSPATSNLSPSQMQQQQYTYTAAATGGRDSPMVHYTHQSYNRPATAPGGRVSVMDKTTFSTEQKRRRAGRGGGGTQEALRSPSSTSVNTTPNNPTKYRSKLPSSSSVQRGVNSEADFLNKRQATTKTKQSAVFRSDTPRFKAPKAESADIDYDVQDPREIATNARKNISTRHGSSSFASRTNRWHALYSEIELPTIDTYDDLPPTSISEDNQEYYTQQQHIYMQQQQQQQHMLQQQYQQLDSNFTPSPILMDEQANEYGGGELPHRTGQHHHQVAFGSSAERFSPLVVRERQKSGVLADEHPDVITL